MAWDPEGEVKIWDKTASGTGHQTIWPQLPLGGGRLGRVDRIEAGGAYIPPDMFRGAYSRFSAKKAITKACHRGYKLQMWGYCWRTSFNVPKPTFLHRIFQVLVSSKRLYTE